MRCLLFTCRTPRVMLWSLGDLLVRQSLTALLGGAANLLSPQIARVLHTLFLYLREDAACAVLEAVQSMAAAYHARESPPAPDNWKDGTGGGICSLSSAERVTVVQVMARCVCVGPAGDHHQMLRCLCVCVSVADSPHQVFVG